MRSEKFQNALGMIDPELVSRANVMPRVHRYKRTVISVAAILAVSIAMGAFWWMGMTDDGDGADDTKKPHTTSLADTDDYYKPDDQPVDKPSIVPIIKQPAWTDEGVSEDYDPSFYSEYLKLGVAYPVMTKYPGDNNYNTPEYQLWKNDVKKQLAYKGAGEGLESFFGSTVYEFLSGRGNGNSVYSPLNVYFSLAMIAENVSTNERGSILELLGVENIEELRTKVNAIWNANYSDEGTVKSVFANSLWLDKDVGADEALVDTLVKSYHASVFEGDFGSAEYDFAVRSWINEHTGGLVDKLSDVKFDPAALVAFVSTVEFNARWSDEFDPALTMERTFHSPDGKIKCDFMYDERITGYYTGENFSAVKSYLLNSGAVTFILPDKDCSVETLLSDPEAIAFLFDNSKAEVHKNMKVKLSVPKFEIQSDMDLIQGLEDLGIDLESISFEDGGFISEIRHGAAVSIDEKGVKAAAVTISQKVESIPNGEVSFVLDRPFMFVITGEDDLPLFVGIVNHP